VSPEELPDLYNAYVLPDDAPAHFQQNGWVVLRGVASREEVAQYRPILANAVQRLNGERRPLEERDTYGKAFLQTINLWERDQTVRRWVMARRFAKVAAELMGVSGTRLYHDQALYKEAGGGITPWHQDQYYWPLDTQHSITMWMPLVELTEESGIMEFACGSHRDGFAGQLHISDDSEEELSKRVSEKGYRIAGPRSMAPGDATFHSGWTLHRAPPNRTDRMREVMTIIYYADGTRVGQPKNDSQAGDLRAFHPGVQPGELAVSPLNPLLYPA
jgi:ectoine hydroxylase-related dioxygenase (phytanoyl-CoA dioxygenase family)